MLVLNTPPFAGESQGDTSITLAMLGHGYAKQHAAPAKHMLGAGLARAPS
jgi:hypothetical protein